jgi:hypothetical protein
MTPQDAAALLEAQRNDELQPSDVVRRQTPARDADPERDW